MNLHAYPLHMTHMTADVLLVPHEPCDTQVREQRLAAEISVAKRERDFYLSRVDKAKAADAMRQRKQLKADKVCGGECDINIWYNIFIYRTVFKYGTLYIPYIRYILYIYLFECV